jgi:two-component system response regulator FixJ
MLRPPTIHIIDEDSRVRESIQRLAATMSLKAKSYPSAAHFLTEYREESIGCVVLDARPLRPPDVPALPIAGQKFLPTDNLQQYLQGHGLRLPVIALVVDADTPQTVQAMKRGAVTVLEKPVTDKELSAAIEEALTVGATILAVLTRLDPLTVEERAVLAMLTEGKPNKLIARELGFSLRTVETRRHHIFRKTQTNTLAELVKLVVQADMLSTRYPIRNLRFRPADEPNRRQHHQT